MKLKSIAFVSIVATVLLTVTSCRAQKQIAGQRMAETIMTVHRDSLVVKKYVTHGPSEEKVEARAGGPSTWNYEIGVVLEGFDELHKRTGDKRYFQYMQKIIDHFVRLDGSIRTYDFLEYNIDHITPGRIVLALYKETKDEKYRKAAALLREQLVWHPRTKEGGFWHKHRYPYQMWLDGLYMAEPFYAEYSVLFDDPAAFDDIANQFIWMEKHSRDERTGLLYHAWDESKKQRWADPQTGKSREFWSRAMGWYAMALVDVLDDFPGTHPKREDLIAIFKRLCSALKNHQDSKSGVWYQITDKPAVKGNYLEASASCMFVYSMAKGIRLGYLDHSFDPVVKNGFDGVLKNFVQMDEKGMSHLIKTCSGAGLGGNPYRDGSFDYYINEPLRTDDLKGVGPFILMSIECELLKK
jgi:rhamnogalacturonyl hydrolase YesR